MQKKSQKIGKNGDFSMKKVAFHNLGCKVNSYELDGIQQNFQKAEYKIVDFAQKADVYVINTCSVTNIADRKSRQMIHKAKKQNPEAVVVALGCYVQAMDGDGSDPDIDIVIGNNLKSQTFEIVDEYIKNRGNDFSKTSDIHLLNLKEEQSYEEQRVENCNEHTRAFIKIQDGCDQYCSYCIIPYVRGHIRSRRIEDIMAEIAGLTKAGYKEFVITGIHLSSYGIEETSYNEFAKTGRTNTSLLEVINAASAIEGVERIRLGSLEPRLMTEEFLKGITSNEKVCPHFHLSLQSGCDSVLKRMNRHYTTDEFERVVERIRSFYEHPAITTDVIVGFPGETEGEFERTREYLEKIKLYEVHLFKYSRRKGTVADKMPDQLTDKEKSKRSGILLKGDERNRNDFAKWYVGKRVEILLEDMEEINGSEYMVGYTKNYVKCAVTLPEGESAAAMEGKIISAEGMSVEGIGTLLCRFKI